MKNSNSATRVIVGIGQLAQRTPFSVSQIRRLMRAGKLPHKRIGYRTVVFDLGEIEPRINELFDCLKTEAGRV